MGTLNCEVILAKVYLGCKTRTILRFHLFTSEQLSFQQTVSLKNLSYQKYHKLSLLIIT
jgi:hypothetical protein